MTGRERLAGVLSDELLDAIDELVTERVAAALAEVAPAGSPWLALTEAAEYANVSERTMQRLVGKGRIRSTTVGRRRLLHRDDLDELLRDDGGGDSANRSTPSPRGVE